MASNFKLEKKPRPMMNWLLRASNGNKAEKLRAGKYILTAQSGNTAQITVNPDGSISFYWKEEFRWKGKVVFYMIEDKNDGLYVVGIMTYLSPETKHSPKVCDRHDPGQITKGKDNAGLGISSDNYFGMSGGERGAMGSCEKLKWPPEIVPQEGPTLGDFMTAEQKSSESASSQTSGEKKTGSASSQTSSASSQTSDDDCESPSFMRIHVVDSGSDSEDEFHPVNKSRPTRSTSDSRSELQSALIEENKTKISKLREMVENFRDEASSLGDENKELRQNNTILAQQVAVERQNNATLAQQLAELRQRNEQDQFMYMKQLAEERSRRGPDLSMYAHWLQQMQMGMLMQMQPHQYMQYPHPHAIPQHAAMFSNNVPQQPNWNPSHAWSQQQSQQQPNVYPVIDPPSEEPVQPQVAVVSQSHAERVPVLKRSASDDSRILRKTPGSQIGWTSFRSKDPFAGRVSPFGGSKESL